MQNKRYDELWNQYSLLNLEFRELLESNKKLSEAFERQDHQHEERMQLISALAYQKEVQGNNSTPARNSVTVLLAKECFNKFNGKVKGNGD